MCFRKKSNLDLGLQVTGIRRFPPSTADCFPKSRLFGGKFLSNGLPWVFFYLIWGFSAAVVALPAEIPHPQEQQLFQGLPILKNFSNLWGFGDKFSSTHRLGRFAQGRSNSCSILTTYFLFSTCSWHYKLLVGSFLQTWQIQPILLLTKLREGNSCFFHGSRGSIPNGMSGWDHRVSPAQKTQKLRVSTSTPLEPTCSLCKTCWKPLCVVFSRWPGKILNFSVFPGIVVVLEWEFRCSCFSPKVRVKEVEMPITQDLNSFESEKRGGLKFQHSSPSAIPD